MVTTNWLERLAQHILSDQLAHSRWNYLQTLAKLEVAEHRGSRYRWLYLESQAKLRETQNYIINTGATL